MDRPSDYYMQARSELLPLIEPIGGAVILDVGCGAGALGRQLKEKGAAAVHGIEAEKEAAQAAAPWYHNVLACPVEQVDFTAYKEFFDVIICADILEHLADPWDLLARLRGALKPNGALVASIPNFRHRKVIGNLLAGRLDYLSAGILDKSHLRFFTFQSVVEMFRNAGYRIDSIGPVYNVDADEILPQWKASDMRGKLKEIVFALSGKTHDFTDDDLMDLFTHQFLLRARKSASV